MRFTRYVAIFCLLAVTVSTAACSGMTRSDKAAVKTWWLEPYTVVNQGPSAEPPALLKARVSAVPGLDTDRILTLTDDAQLNHFAAARWADNLPELVSSLVKRSLQASGRFEVARGRHGGRVPRCDLHLEVREFFAHLDVAGQVTGVQLAISGRYQCGAGEPVSIELRAKQPVQSQRMNEIVAAFQQALDGAMVELLKQVE